MADKNLWTTFEKTGNIVDYLNYKGIHMDSTKQEAGESAVESRSNSHRDDTIRNTYR